MNKVFRNLAWSYPIKGFVYKKDVRGSHRRAAKTGLMCSLFLVLVNSRAVEF